MRLYKKLYKGEYVSDIVYDSAAEFLQANPNETYVEFRKLCNLVMNVKEKRWYFDSLVGKWVMSDDRRVCKILGFRYEIMRNKYLISRMITPIGTFKINKKIVMLESFANSGHSKKPKDLLFDYIQFTGSFFAAIQIMRQDIWLKAGGDKLKILEICHKNKILNRDFFVRLKLMMGDKLGTIFDDSELPVKTAKEALENIMKTSEDQKLVANVALRIYEIGLEFEKAKMEFTNGGNGRGAAIPHNPFTAPAAITAQ